MGNPIPKIKKFYAETVQEVKKSTWPSRKELIQQTGLVIVAVLLLTAFIAVSDKALQQVVMWVFRFPELWR